MIFRILFFLIVLLPTHGMSAQNDPFITLWIIEMDDTISIPLQSFTYDFDYTWTLTSDTSVQNSGTHTNADGAFTTAFELPGIYQLEITGQFPHMKAYPKAKLLDVMQWGDISWRSLQEMFENWPGVGFSALDAPDLSQVRNFIELFKNASNFNEDLDHWDVSTIQEMARMFQNASSFNGNISNWDVSSVVDLSATFHNAIAFNRDLHAWNVMNVENMRLMFRNARNFNQFIGGWNTSRVRHMENMFRDAIKFNRPIGKWDVGSVVDMSNMFRNAQVFNQEINNWNVSKAVAMRDMFRSAGDFNQSLGGWVFDSLVVFQNSFLNTAMDCQSWSSTIIGWNFSNPQLTDINIGGPNVEYDTIAAIARDELIARGWTMNGTAFLGSCSAMTELRCQDTVAMANDTLYGHLFLGAAQELNLTNIVIQAPGDVLVSAPEVNLNAGSEILAGIELEITTNSGCP